MIKNDLNEIKIISFDMFGFSKAEYLKAYLREYNIDTFLFVPHFKGDLIYLEDNFSNYFKPKIIKIISKIVSKMQDNLNIRYFARVHQEKFKERYGIKFLDGQNYSIPVYDTEYKKFDIERCSYLWERDEFNILTISRFEIPHKGYIVGLIKAYAALKKKYPFITLTIAGYGRDQKILEDEITRLPYDVRKDIRMVGKVSPLKMVDLYSNANVNVSVAGCYNAGVKNGTLSIPARHYVCSCEVYGLSPEANAYSVSTEKGKDIIPYLEKIINMPRETYIKYCKASYLSKLSNDDSERDYVVDIKNRSSRILRKSDIIFIYIVYCLKAIRLRLKINKFKLDMNSKN